MTKHKKSFSELLSSLYKTTGINAFVNPSDDAERIFLINQLQKWIIE